MSPPKGKLSVRISEARGLRPSHDPYVVCVFEWNEYISKGPKPKPTDIIEMEPEDLMRGIPMKRSGSDMGQPIAIPMKSRQSSNTSLPDQRDFRDRRSTTDPKWDHEATL